MPMITWVPWAKSEKTHAVRRVRGHPVAAAAVATAATPRSLAGTGAHTPRRRRIESAMATTTGRTTGSTRMRMTSGRRPRRETNSSTKTGRDHDRDRPRPRAPGEEATEAAARTGRPINDETGTVRVSTIADTSPATEPTDPKTTTASETETETGTGTGIAIGIGIETTAERGTRTRTRAGETAIETETVIATEIETETETGTETAIAIATVTESTAIGARSRSFQPLSKGPIKISTRLPGREAPSRAAGESRSKVPAASSRASPPLAPRAALPSADARPKPRYGCHPHQRRLKIPMRRSEQRGTANVSSRRHGASRVLRARPEASAIGRRRTTHGGPDAKADAERW